MITMTRALSIALLTLAVSMSGCSHLQCVDPAMKDIEVKAVHDEKVNFSALKTFAWAGNVGVLVDETGSWVAPEFDVTNELDFLIERELRNRGFVAVSHDPDVFVVHALLVDVQAPTPEEIEAGMSMGELSAGALLIQLMDGQTLSPIWRGAAAAQPNDKRTDEEVRRRLDYGVRQIFATYPD